VPPPNSGEADRPGFGPMLKRLVKSKADGRRAARKRERQGSKSIIEVESKFLARYVAHLGLHRWCARWQASGN